MILTRISMFLIFSILLVTVKSIDVVEIYDIEAMKNFVDKLENKVKNKYNLRNATSDDEQSKMFGVIFGDMTDVLKTLNRFHNDSYKNYWDVAMNNFMELFDDYEVNSGLSRWSTSLFDHYAVINVKRDLSDTYVRGVLYLHDHNYLTSTNHSCSYLTVVIDFFDRKDIIESIIDVYKNFLTSVLISMNFAEEWLSVCGKRTAMNEQLYQYYQLVTTSYLKIWTIDYFTGILRAYCEHKSPKVFMEDARNTLIKKLTVTMRLNKKIIIENNKQYIYQCDGQTVNDVVNFMDYQQNKKTYYELEKMMQVVIVNEKDMSSIEDCSFDCDLSKLENLNGYGCKTFSECRYITKSFDICEPEKNDSRNYQWFKDSNGVVYGPDQNESCPTTVKSVSSYYQASTMHFCDYCVCICYRYPENKPNVVTAISFRGQISNIMENKVVVGVRFIKKDNMIHVQIKEANLDLSLEGVESIKWKELENFVYNEDLDQYHIIVDSIEGSLSLGLDYGHPETMNFDDLIAPQGHIITGVRFRFAGDSHDSPSLKFGAIELQIRVSPFDIIQKKIINNIETHWISPKYQDKRDELVLHKLDNPTKSIENNIDSKPGQFIRFQASDLKKDAGQSTVPFFDALPAEGAPEFALGGVGIIHKGSNASGGYLAFRIFDLDVSKNFKVPFESESII